MNELDELIEIIKRKFREYSTLSQNESDMDEANFYLNRAYGYYDILCIALEIRARRQSSPEVERKA